MTKPVLAFDTAFGGCVAAVWNPATGASVSRSLATERGQSVHLIPLIQEVLAEAGLTFRDLGLLVANPGPGSFTGLRISLMTAKSLALALSIPVQGAGSFEVMARSCMRQETVNRILVLLESKRADFYAQRLDPDFRPLGDAFCACADTFLGEEFRGYSLCGDGIPRLEKEVGAEKLRALFPKIYAADLPDPAVLLEEGVRIFTRNGGIAAPLEPVYLRDPDVSVPKTHYRHIGDI